jgi:Mg/Co/Ni transporter MgtE
MDKRQLIEAIREHNPTAEIRFLNQFNEAQLQQYLDALDAARRKDLLIAGWVRPRPRLRMAS